MDDLELLAVWDRLVLKHVDDFVWECFGKKFEKNRIEQKHGDFHGDIHGNKPSGCLCTMTSRKSR